MVDKILPAKDRSISSAVFYGSGREAEYRILGNPGLVLVVLAPKPHKRTARVWRCYYSRTVDGHRFKRKMRLA